MQKFNQRVVTVEVTVAPETELTDEQVCELLLIKSKDKDLVKVKCYGVADPEPA
jgi:hypothetical protein